MKHVRLFPQLAGILLLLLLGCTGIVTAQSPEGHQIKVQVSEILHMEVGEADIAFNLSTPYAGEQYPAASYPAYYTPTSNQKHATIRVFSNCDSEWMMMIYGQTEHGRQAPTIEWSLNGEQWLPLEEGGQVLTQGGFTSGWSEIKVYFRLVIRGAEYGGEEYKVHVFYNLTSM